MPEFTIERLGQRDLTFTGELIGQSDGQNPAAKIYKTKAGKFVGQVKKDAKRSNAAHFDKPGDVVNWFQSQLGTPLTPEAQAAVEKARDKDQQFKEFWTEHIE